MKNILIIILVLVPTSNLCAQSESTLFVGTYTHSCDSEGIYVFKFDAAQASFQQVAKSNDIKNPSYLSVSSDQKTIYSVIENGNESAVGAFTFNENSNELTFVNSQISDADPCHIIDDESNVIVATYSGGSIAVFRKSTGSSLTDPVQMVSHQGKSINADRQSAPHVHMVQFSPDKKFVIASDLGTDQIVIYNYTEAAAAPLTFSESIAVNPGSGPRHFTFSPNGKRLYLLQELDGTITVFKYRNGNLTKVQETSVVSELFPGTVGAAAIKMSADGNFLYATNRGDVNTISVFAVAANGKLNHLQTLSSGGESPRDFAIDPSGKFLLVAHEKSNEVVVFKRNIKNGRLMSIAQRLQICAPVCLVFGK